jgi:hypothetical protein
MEVRNQFIKFDTIILEKLNVTNDQTFEFRFYPEDEDSDEVNDKLIELDAQSQEIDNIEAEAAWDEIILTQPLLLKDGTISEKKYKRMQKG